MAMPVSLSRPIVGVDVAKKELVIFHRESERLETIQNDKTSIRKWLKTVQHGTRIAIEATNTFHVLFADLAYEKGCVIYIIDGYQLSCYRKGVNVRAKTDAKDAWLLARYLHKELDELTPWVPACPLYRDLQGLFRRRAALVQAYAGLKQSWSNEPHLKSAFMAHIRSMERLLALVEAQIKKALHMAGLTHQLKRCMQIEGIGFLNAARLVTAFMRGDFKGADAFIAFLGMDLRVSKSGEKNGRRSLTKRGDPEVRRLLYVAAMAASKTTAWKPFYEAQRKRGFSTTEVFVMLARKLARVAFALLKNQSEYHTKMA